MRQVKGTLTLDDNVLRFSHKGVSDIIIKLDGATKQVVERAFIGMASQNDDFCLLHAYGIGDSEKFQEEEKEMPYDARYCPNCAIAVEEDPNVEETYHCSNCGETWSYEETASEPR